MTKSHKMVSWMWIFHFYIVWIFGHIFCHAGSVLQDTAWKQWWRRCWLREFNMYCVSNSLVIALLLLLWVFFFFLRIAGLCVKRLWRLHMMWPIWVQTPSNTIESDSEPFSQDYISNPVYQSTETKQNTCHYSVINMTTCWCYTKYILHVMYTVYILRTEWKIFTSKAS